MTDIVNLTPADPELQGYQREKTDFARNAARVIGTVPAGSRIDGVVFHPDGQVTIKSTPTDLGTGDPVVPAKTAGDAIGDAIVAGLQGRISDGTWVAPSSSLHPQPKKEADLNIERQAMVEDLREMQEHVLRLFDRMHRANVVSYVCGEERVVYSADAMNASRQRIREGFMWAKEACFPAPRMSLPDDDGK